MKGFLKKILCKHKNSEVICWHWTHGPNGNDIRFLEIQRKCTECGKYFFTHKKVRMSVTDLLAITQKKNGLTNANPFYKGV